jgi:hypothetical protein
MVNAYESGSALRKALWPGALYSVFVGQLSMEASISASDCDHFRCSLVIYLWLDQGDFLPRWRVRKPPDVFRTECLSKGLPVAVINSGFGPVPDRRRLSGRIHDFPSWQLQSNDCVTE